MSSGWFWFIIGLLLIFYGGGVLLNHKILAWVRKVSSVKLLAILCIILGAFAIYTAVVILRM